MNEILSYLRLNLLIVPLVLVVVTTTAQAGNEVIKISTDPWAPWVLGDEGGAPTGGVAVELAKDVFRRLGVKYDIQIYPYKRCIAQMKSGERDIILMAKKTPERERFMVFSNVAARDPQLIYFSTKHIKDFNWNSWEDLKGYRIGGVRGFDYGDFHAAKETLQLQFETVVEDTQNIKKLLAGRVDLILLSRSTAEHYLDQHPELKADLRAASKPVAEAVFHFALSKKGQALKYLKQINRTLNELGSADSVNGLIGKHN